MAQASTILMIRPAAFGPNPETASSNFFQESGKGIEQNQIQANALDEFDQMVSLLREHLFDIMVIEDTLNPPKPSAIFPNNWIGTSPAGDIWIFPLFAPSRRAEKRDDIIKVLMEKFEVRDLQDWSGFEAEGKFLEGTGSMVIDHDHRVIYACYSPRTDISVLEEFADKNDFRAIVFLAKDKYGQPVYHTNVVMGIGNNFAVLCEEAIEEEWERFAVRQLLEGTGHEIIPITLDQMHGFAANMIELRNRNNENYIVLSHTAFDQLNKEQIKQLSSYAHLLAVPVPTIEKSEGGSVRCMIAEIFLKQKVD